MANYNVGNIEISATAKTNDTIAKLDKIIDKLQEVKDVQRKNKSSQSGVNNELDKTKTKIDKNANTQKKHKLEVDKTKQSINALSSSIIWLSFSITCHTYSPGKFGINIHLIRSICSELSLDQGISNVPTFSVFPT